MAYELCGITAEKGQKVRGWVDLFEYSDGSKARLPVTIIHGVRHGDVVYVGAGAHGDAGGRHARWKTYASNPPMIAPRSSGPTCSRRRARAPKPTSAPITGMPVSNEPKRVSAILVATIGKKTAMTAGPTPPAFWPPTMPAMSGPTTGSQKSSSEMRNIHPMPLVMLPFRWGSASAAERVNVRRFSRVLYRLWRVR